VASTYNDDNHCDSLLKLITSNITNCRYYNLDSKFKDFKNTQLFLLHINVRSLQKHFDTLNEIITNSILKPDVICLTESRIKPDTMLCSLDLYGYDFVFTSPHKNI